MAEQETSAAVATNPRRGGRRRGKKEDDEQEGNVVANAVDHINAAAEELLPAPPRAPAAKAPSAAMVAPQSSVAQHHVDPEKAMAVPPPSAVAASTLHTTTTSSPTRPPITAFSVASNAEEVFNLNFDTLSYNELIKILQKVPRVKVEERLVLRGHQAQLMEQHQQNQRIEKFLDIVAAGSFNASSNPTKNGSNQDAPPHGTTECSVVVNGNGNGGYTEEEGYSYGEMLTRLFEALNRNNEGSAVTERNQIPVPILERIGKKRTVISNFGRICEAFHRPLEDVKDFIEKELSTRGNIDSNNALILKFETRKATDFDPVLIKYVDDYVKCYSCRRIDTTLTKDGRRLELRCNCCTATRTVQAIGSATFSAQIEKRSRQRAAVTL